MPSTTTLTVLSLGGGVQSSVKALMAGERVFERGSDCAPRRRPMGAAQRLQAPRMAHRPDGVSSAHRGQRTQPPSETQDSSQPPKHSNIARPLYTYSRS